MTESSVYQAILEEGRKIFGEEAERQGRTEQAKKILPLIGGQRFGEPDDRVRKRIESIEAVDRLERLAERLLSASDWIDLLATL